MDVILSNHRVLCFPVIFQAYDLICERFQPRNHFKSKLSLIVPVNGNNLCACHLQSQSVLYHVSWWYYTLVIDLNTIKWRDTNHLDSEDDYRSGCRNVSHYQQQQSYSGLRSPGRSNSTYFYNLMLLKRWMKYQASQSFPFEGQVTLCTVGT